MKAILCSHFGPPEALQLADIDAPRAGPGEALVRVKAVALNFFDTLLIAGKYQHKPPFPFSPGAEFAGLIESVGNGAGDLAPGDRVIGYNGWGAARELVTVNTQRLVKIPDRLDFERAAGLTVTYSTTLYALRERAGLKPGESLVVLGASGGPKCEQRIAFIPRIHFAASNFGPRFSNHENCGLGKQTRIQQGRRISQRLP